jgi:hypothetical protein
MCVWCIYLGLERLCMSPGLILGLEWSWARVQGRQRAVS